MSASSPDSVHRLSGAVVQSLVSALRTAAAGRGQRTVGAGLADESFFSLADGLREADRETTNRSRRRPRPTSWVGCRTTSAATRSLETGALRTPTAITVVVARRGEPGRDRLGGADGPEQAAGIGVPLVAMVCHSDDPLLLRSGGAVRFPRGKFMSN